MNNLSISKQQEEQEKKRLEQLQKKAEAKALLEKEMESIKSKVAPPPPKITRAHITMMKEKTIKQEAEKPIVIINYFYIIIIKSTFSWKYIC